jgi:hypothetical protein
MKYALSQTLGLIVLVLVAFATVPAGAQTTANGPYYATPSWDQQFPASTRFIVLANWNSEAVLDRETGIVWEQNPSPHGNAWAAAHQDLDFGCIARTTGGRSGWRVPRLEELQSLTVGEFNDLPAGHPFGPNASGTFWTATTSAFNSNSARVWAIGRATRTIIAFDKSSNEPLTWCVRSPTPGFVGQ